MDNKNENTEFKALAKTSKNICKWVVDLKTKNPYKILDSLKLEFPMMDNRQRDLISFVVRDNEEIKTWCASQLKSEEMETVTNAVEIIEGLPAALKHWVANFIVDTLPGLDAAGSDSITMLKEQTGLNEITCSLIIRGWLFDLKDIITTKAKNEWTH
jgi:hypothetical protein